ncbi:EpsG family protein [Chlorobium sp. BLA1]|uniref:EpsG family protein n=1 Tax=Candidatus Chlorobium masyuteum TaxID=2716876 RepID=UPI001420DEA6|nr:EpsG family protein [Candidatus Chlorobium masyuteum]NHQ59221.1 EpsG family protein [Candidatus Chlorobium masyuteum]
MAGGKPMTTYWLMFLVPMLAGLSPWKAKGALPNVQWFLYGFLLIFILGLRHEVGGDWSNYIDNFTWLKEYKFLEVISFSNLSLDLGYLIVYWFSLHYLNGIYATNIICAAIFVSGLLRVCREMPIQWLALCVAIPYLVIVVAMGYTRQAAAIGFIMWGLIDLIKGRQIRFYIMVLLGSLFHKTAFLMLPVGFLYTNSLRNLKDLIIFIILFGIAFLAFLADRIANLVHFYITDTGGMESSGAFIRVMMNVISASVFIYFRKAWAERYDDGKLWLIFSVVSIVMLPLTIVISTTIDRMALYFLPMQLVILSRTPSLIKSTYVRTLFILSVLFLYIGALFVWLNFGTHSSNWLPYQNLFFL